VSVLASLAASITGGLVTGLVKIEVSVVLVLSFNKLVIVAWKLVLIELVLFWPAVVRGSTFGVTGLCEAKRLNSNPACGTVGLATLGVLGALDTGEE
jgi:hypothetical protein